MTVVAAGLEASREDIEGIQTAALDYVEAYVMGDEDRHARAYHPECLKRRLSTDEASGATEMITLSPQMMVDAAATGETVIEDCEFEIFIDDVSQDIASMRVYSCAWVDFLHVAKARGEWRLLHVTWHRRSQSET